MQAAITLPAKLEKHPWPRQANDTKSNEDTLGAPHIPEPDHPAELGQRGLPAELGELGETVPPPVGNDTAKSATVVNRKVMHARSPLPVRAKRPAHPGAPDMVRPRRTSAEVTATAKRKAVL